MPESNDLLLQNRCIGLVALRIVSVGLGVFFLAMSLNKVGWFGNPNLLTDRFIRWMPTASPYARVYLRAVAIPGGRVFARVVPIAELLAALAFLTGVRTHLAAAAALLMIMNFHIATSSFSALDFLRDGTGPPMFAALAALACVRETLPFSLEDVFRKK